MKSLVLVLEDDPIIAMDASETMRHADFLVLGPCHSVKEAFDALQTQRPDVAILDLNLGQETSEPVARHLKEIGVPFVILSGQETRSLSEELQKELRLPKPFQEKQLISTIRSLL